MFWIIIIVLFVVVVAAAANSSGASKAASVVQSMASMMGSEARFREYWRFMHTELLGGALHKDQEDKFVERYLSEYLELMTQLRTVTPENVQVMLPAFAMQSDNLDIKIANSMSSNFGKVMSSNWKRERAQKKFMKNVLGIRL